PVRTIERKTDARNGLGAANEFRKRTGRDLAMVSRQPRLGRARTQWRVPGILREQLRQPHRALNGRASVVVAKTVAVTALLTVGEGFGIVGAVMDRFQCLQVGEDVFKVAVGHVAKYLHGIATDSLRAPLAPVRITSTNMLWS